MKLGEQLRKLIEEIENCKFPEDKDAYIKISAAINKLKMEGTSVHQLESHLDKIENIQWMMQRYLPTKSIYDTYGSPGISNKDWNYNNLAKERKRLIATLKTFKTLVEDL